MRSYGAKPRQELRVFLVGTEFFSSGGIQYVNRLLQRMLEEFALGTPTSAEVFSYLDPAGALSSDDSSVAVRWHGCERKRGMLALSLAQRLCAARPHLVLFTHVHLVRLAPVVRTLSPRTRLGVLAHGKEVWGRLPRSVSRFLRAADGVVTPSRHTRQQLIQNSGVAPERIAVIAHGLAPEWKAEHVPTRSPRAGRVLLSVARLSGADGDKGIDVVLRAMPSILERCPGARYVVIGDGEDRARLETIARSMGIASHVEFRGEITDAALRLVYQEADVFVLPSKQEGFGIVFLEAMYHGLPVVAARAGGSTEVVADGVTGILVPPDDTAQLAAAVSRLLLNPIEASAMGAAGRALVHHSFLFQHFAARWQHWLAQVSPEPIYLARHAAVFHGPSAAATVS